MKQIYFTGKPVEVIRGRLPQDANIFAGKPWDEIPDNVRFDICKELDNEYHSITKNRDAKKEAGTLASISKFFKKLGCRLSNFGYAQTWQDLGIVENPEPEKRSYQRTTKTGTWKSNMDVSICREIIPAGTKVVVVDTEIEELTNAEIVKVKFEDNLLNPYGGFFRKHFIFIG